MANPDFLQITTAAPALARGFAILDCLGKNAPRSLESLADELTLPKASLFRLLQTLQQLGLVRKNQDKQYEALCRLQSLEDPAVTYRESIIRKMPELCHSTGCTVEWYEPAADGMRLVHQQNPDSELRVMARPGFVREWNKEFEPVARLGHAFAPQAPDIAQVSLYLSNGVLKPLSNKDAQQLLNEARRQKSAHDVPFNSNGVRRCATAAFHADNGTFHGVLALAEGFHFGRQHRPQARHLLKQLKEILPFPQP